MNQKNENKINMTDTNDLNWINILDKNDDIKLLLIIRSISTRNNTITNDITQ